MTCASCAAASRAYSSCLSIMESLSPVQVVCTSAARTTVIDSSSGRETASLERRGAGGNGLANKVVTV